MHKGAKVVSVILTAAAISYGEPPRSWTLDEYGQDRWAGDTEVGHPARTSNQLATTTRKPSEDYTPPKQSGSGEGPQYQTVVTNMFIMCIHPHVYICMYVHIHKCTCMYTYIYMYIWVNL